MSSTGSGPQRETIVRRVLQGSAWMAAGSLSSQGLRLVANLILTRLLFPEAFGLMALVTAFIIGMSMFSDVGILPWIQQNKKGDDPVYLDTAWTVQVARGVILWLVLCLLAAPLATFFDEPALALLLPVAGLELLIMGFVPTRAHAAYRHLDVGRVVSCKLASQVVGIVIMVALAWQLQSVWALVIGTLARSVAQVLMMHYGLSGHVNRFALNRKAASEIIGFGQWIFLSTICGFIVTQGDKLILGKLLSTQTLGIYNIGFFLASFPVLLAETVARKVLIPLYRDRPPAASHANFVAIRRLRFGVTGGIFLLLAALGLFGTGLVDLLYDDRYALSGVLLVLVACSQMPLAIGLTYAQAALASGNSQQFFWVVAVKAALLLAFMLYGTWQFGVVGTIAGQAAAHLLTLPAIVLLARAQGAWDWLHDALFLLASLGISATAVWLHWEAIGGAMGPGVLG
ncbi:MAG: oligosaccharide flippase family protein [Roseovarius sp.]